MHKLRVGIVIDLNLLKTTGGAFSYYHSLLRGINEFKFDEAIEIVNIVFYKKKTPEVDFAKPVVFIKGSIVNSINFHRKVDRMIANSTLKSALKKTAVVQHLLSFFAHNNNTNVKQQLMVNNIDLVYYLKPEYVKSIDYPFITNHWDIGHKSTYAFPELTMDGSYERRENYYSNILNKASLIFCESESGKAELANYYNFNTAKIKVLPTFGNSKLIYCTNEESTCKILSNYQLTANRFFLYPAQFWANKNHYNLIMAFYSFRKRDNGSNYKLVLCGSDHGNMPYIKRVVKALLLDDAVIFTDFVSDEELHALYSNATALVMPAFLGPTNMPLIEAAHLRCPVLCSDLDGHKEIMGENALYFTPENADTIEKALTLITNDELRLKLREAALLHIRQSAFNLETSLQRLNKSLLELKPIRKTWG